MPRAKMPSMLATEFPILADQREKISALNEVIKSADYRESLAAALGLAALPTDLVDRISELCYAYILTEAGSPGTTVGSAQLALTRIIVALEKAIGSGVPAHRNKATRIMRSLTDCRSEIAGEIRARLDAFGPNPFPEPVLAEAKSLLSWVKRLKRVDAKSESFREFCGRLGLLFAESTKFDFKDRQDSWLSAASSRLRCFGWASRPNTTTSLIPIGLMNFCQLAWQVARLRLLIRHKNVPSVARLRGIAALSSRIAAVSRHCLRVLTWPLTLTRC